MLDLLARAALGRGAWPAVPAVAFLVVVMVVPLALLLSFAVTEVTVARGRIVTSTFTLQYVQTVLTDDLTLRSFGRSLWLGVSVTGLCFVLGFPVAYVYTFAGPGLRRAILIVTIAPLLTSGVVRTYAWLVILGGQRGLVNGALLGLGLIERPLRILNTHWAVLIGMTQVHLPLMILPLVAVLTRHERALDEASANLGASRLQTLWHVVLPLAAPGIGTGASLVFTLTYTTFVVPQLLGGGNTLNAATMIYEQMIVALDWNRGAVGSILLLASCSAVVALITWATHRATRWNVAARTAA